MSERRTNIPENAESRAGIASPVREGGGGSLVVLLLAERARSEGARSTRALEDRPGRPLRGVERRKARDEKAWKDTQVGPVLPERAP